MLVGGMAKGALITVSLLAWLSLSVVNAREAAFLVKDPFYWGTATASYQIEGGATEGGRGLSIWDTFSSLPGKTDHGDTGAIADDHYHKFIEDIELLKKLGVNAYRFSIAWTRILPHGSGAINQEGIDFYNKIIDALLINNIEPFVTLFHWDLPQGLEDDYGGLLSSQFEIDFQNYADICFQHFGDRVKKWITLNEPWTVSWVAYGAGGFAPGRCSDRSRCEYGDSTTESYIAGHNLLNAHAAAVVLYRDKYKPVQYGEIGIVLNMDWAEPYDSNNLLDQQAAQRRREFALAWFADPIFFGHYPESMVELTNDRLPQFTVEQATRLKGSIDFLGMNHYSTKYILYRQDPENDIMGYDGSERLPAAVNATSFPTAGWNADQWNYESAYDQNNQLIGSQGESPWLQMVPWGFRKMLNWVNDRYKVSDHSSNLWIYITENGCDVLHESSILREEALNDTWRVEYYDKYLQELDKVILEDDVKVIGYFAWSLLDNFEWADGYTKRFGLHYVDYTDPNRARYAKRSAGWYHDHIQEMQSENRYSGRTRVIPPAHLPIHKESNRLVHACLSGEQQCGWWEYFAGAMEVAVKFL